jgi:hypothetical protein
MPQGMMPQTVDTRNDDVRKTRAAKWKASNVFYLDHDDRVQIINLRQMAMMAAKPPSSDIMDGFTA